MGIRVHKFLGYGFTGLKEDDPRVNWDSPLLDYDGEGMNGLSYYRWLQRKEDAASRDGKFRFSVDWLALRESAARQQERLRDCVARDAEDGLGNVLAVRPLSCGDWHRYDDSIDYVTETWLPGPDGRQQDWVREVGGIHPFDGLFMDAATGEDLPHDVVWFVRVRNALAGDTHISEEEMSALDYAARERTPFPDVATALERVVPRVPPEVRDLCEYGRLLAAPDGWKDMRPLLYTWWG